MYRRVIVVVAGALFSLLGFVAVIVTDLHDRDFPHAIGAHTKLGLDFSSSRLDDREALAKLRTLDAGYGLRMVKVAPDLVDDTDRQVFVSLNDHGAPATFRWFNGGVAAVVDVSRLAHSPPDGTYLVTGKREHLDAFVGRLVDDGVRVTRTDASVLRSLAFVVQEGSFAAAVLAAFALIVALALLWLSMTARSRALRVLGGCPTLRIQVRDLGTFTALLAVAAAVVALGFAVGVGVSRGREFVGTCASALVGLQVAVIAVSLVVALVMSATAWPSAAMLATRQPAVRSLRTAAAVLQVVVFLMVLAAAAPAWAAYRYSAAAAAEMAQWKKLADQVAVRFGVSDEEMTRVEPRVGELVRSAEELDTVAFSYAFDRRVWQGDFGEYSAVAFVNRRWLALMGADSASRMLTSVPYAEVEEMVNREFGETLALLKRGEQPVAELLARCAYFRPSDGFRFPVSDGGSGGGLTFRDDVLLVVVPSVYEAINDRNLTSMMSTSNVLFTGVTRTQELLARHGLSPQGLREDGFTGELRVVYIAEEGILRAQFLSYAVWLMTLSLIALVVAFAVAVGIYALIAALLHAKRDFPLRLAGWSWWSIVRGRAARQVLVGAVLVLAVVFFQRPQPMWPLLAAAGLGAVLVPGGQVLAARWCFGRVSRRQL
ncbi:MAG: hypothetical protein DIU79_02865 [Actinobacteria bacterium]|nr:MAG: hypothetical protein DIU79_02865 [Actinomycetota bacterium]